MDNKLLYNWLEFRFKHDNHVKYTHYFNEWYSNLTKNQIDGFINQLNSKIGDNYLWKN